MNNSSILTTTFCRKCMKLVSCLKTVKESKFTYLCKSCASEESLIYSCRSCGREGVKKEMIQHGGYCHLCERDNVTECKCCGAETYTHTLIDGACGKCSGGVNKPCSNCGKYINTEKLTSNKLCPRCAIKLYKEMKASELEKIVECVECGREELVKNINDGLCIYCYSENLEKEIKKLKKYKKTYNY